MRYLAILAVVASQSRLLHWGAILLARIIDVKQHAPSLAWRPVGTTFRAAGTHAQQGTVLLFDESSARRAAALDEEQK